MAVASACCELKLCTTYGTLTKRINTSPNERIFGNDFSSNSLDTYNASDSQKHRGGTHFEQMHLRLKLSTQRLRGSFSDATDAKKAIEYRGNYGVLEQPREHAQRLR